MKEDGASMQTAFKIVGAKNELEGVAFEYRVVARIFEILKKDYVVLEQMLIHENERSYDCLVLQDQDGKVSEIWFDITDFFGKW